MTVYFCSFRATGVSIRVTIFMMLPRVSFGLVVLFLSTVSLTGADIWPGDGGFYDICVEIIDDVNGNSDQFHLESWLDPALAGGCGEDVTTTFE